MDWITLINALTGTEMSVPESRLDEYLKAGHRLANPAPVPEAELPKPATPAPKAETPKRKTKPKAKA